jgi:hypothetical protein
MENFFLNRTTGEIVESRKIAIEWYRAGVDVEVWVDNELKVYWYH